MQRLHSSEWAEKFQPFDVIYPRQRTTRILTTDVETVHIGSGKLTEHLNYVQTC